MPERTTKDYEGPVVAPKILAMLDEALQVEENIDIDASRIKSYGRHSARPSRYVIIKFSNINPMLSSQEFKFTTRFITEPFPRHLSSLNDKG